MPDFKCNDDRPCFGRKEDGSCDVLREPFKNKPCPFCKPKRFLKADGSRYDFIDRYGIYGMKFEPKEGDSDNT